MIPRWAGGITSNLLCHIQWCPKSPLALRSIQPVKWNERSLNEHLSHSWSIHIRLLFNMGYVAPADGVYAKAERSECIGVQGELDSHIPLKKGKLALLWLLCVYNMCLCVWERETASTLSLSRLWVCFTFFNTITAIKPSTKSLKYAKWKNLKNLKLKWTKIG